MRTNRSALLLTCVLLTGCAGTTEAPADVPCDDHSDCPTEFCSDEGVCARGGGAVGADSTATPEPDDADIDADTGQEITPLDTTDTTADDAGDPDVAGDAATDAGAVPDEGEFGAPCEGNGDCDSGYCIGTSVGRVCTVPCGETCPGGWTCRLLVNSGGDVVQLCVPGAEVLCQPCVDDIDCGGLDDLCIVQSDGSFCGRLCENDEGCPDGFVCNDYADGDRTIGQCVPELAICGDCLDEDGDTYGVGPGCPGTDCDELSLDTYEGAPELCDGLDNDCDGDVDEGFDLATDAINCGWCGHVCELDNATAACAEERCIVAECDEGWGDCNDSPFDGCEVDLTSTPEHCSECGTACAFDNAAPLCVESTCEQGPCTDDWDDCDPEVLGCETFLPTSLDHCGACEEACLVADGTGLCVEGACTVEDCDDRFTDCNELPGDGCEIETAADPLNCGGCGTDFVCDLANAVEACAEGECAVGSCGDGWGDCDGLPWTGCETETVVDPEDCGECGNVCTFDNAAPLCIEGGCALGPCEENWGDCDGLPETGCETDLLTTTGHCGACDAFCEIIEGSGVCIGGDCKVDDCNEGFADCNRLPDDGCEIEIAADPFNCGGCGEEFVCDLSDAFEICVDFVCAIGVCDADRGDCDEEAETGCEVDLLTDPAYCGTCDIACDFLNATPLCVDGGCVQGPCDEGWGDCDPAVPGCETNLLTTLDHCGECDDLCEVTDGDAVCTAGECRVADCADGFTDCNEQPGDGCEIETSADPLNCGGCGAAFVCDLADAFEICVDGECAVGSCEEGYGDCDLEAGTGCERDHLVDPDFCGDCFTDCAFLNAAPLCISGGCVQGPCDAGWGDCNFDGAGCEERTTFNDAHCGECGAVCDLDNATSFCRDTTCELVGCDRGWDSCDGFDFTGCETHSDIDVDHCGDCDTECRYDHATPLCSDGRCAMGTCDGGWVDLDGRADTGCEYRCEGDAGTPDPPDTGGVDADCDGIDGEIGSSVFVAKPANGGNDTTNDGRSPDRPVATIENAMAIADACPGNCDVLVSAGTYSEDLTLRSGVDLYGGYAPGSWGRNISANETIISGSASVTVSASSLSTTTIFDGLTVRGRSYTSGASSTYAIRVSSTPSSRLRIRNSVVQAGTAGAAGNGGSGSDGRNGNTGGAGSGSSGGSGGSSPGCSANGGGGGSSWNCGNGGGGSGTAGGDSSSGGGGGSSGSNRCSGCNDTGGNGGAGGGGGDGNHGGAATANTDSDGSFSSGFFSGIRARSGGRGYNGTGGGGGGAGGTDVDPWYCAFWSETEHGGGGGGGGGAGCHGTAGTGGYQGGGSFGIVLYNSAVEVSDTSIELGIGGAGGDGGSGGDGGTGAAGRAGYSPSNDEGGRGGTGGTGGDGGGGAGGNGACGGPAIGIALVGSSSLSGGGRSYDTGGARGGSGGNGGTGGLRGDGGSRASSGRGGCAGLMANSRNY